MKLLIITQKVDVDDPILGFFHRWIQEFAKRCESVIVICLEQGKHDLPDNVKVFSLGKEGGKSRIKYIFRFYKYIWMLRHEYDAVFVHMNQEYVVLGGVAWKMFRKRIFLWRNHAKGSVMTKLAVGLSQKVFYTSPQSYTAKFKNSMQMPVGVDTEIFKPHSEIERRPNSFLMIGRISPVKKIDEFINALKIVHNNGVKFTATIVGNSIYGDDGYFEKIKGMIVAYDLKDFVKIMPAVRHEDTVKYYCSHEIYVNLTDNGSLDKTIFEAIACMCKIITINNYVREQTGLKIFMANSISNYLAVELIQALDKETDYSIKNLQDSFVNKHSLNTLIASIYEVV